MKKSYLWGAAALVAVVIAVWLYQKEGADRPPAEPEIPLAQLPHTATPLAYDIELTIQPDRERFAGRTAIETRLEEPSDHLWLHGQNLTVKTVTVTLAEGEALPAAYEQKHETGVALVTFPRELEPGVITLHFDYTAPFSTRSDGLYRVNSGGEWYAFTQFEPIDARKVFPGFDEPRFKTPFSIAVVANEEDAVIANGAEKQAEEIASGLVRHVYGKTRPLPTYLIAFAVGPLDVVDYAAVPATELRERPVPLRGVAGKGKGAQLDYALENTAPILIGLEDYFGTPYPYQKLDIIAVPEFAFGAMENVGAIIYREQLLLFGENASLERRRAYGNVHAHELAHQWFGNLVTPVWWDDIWLNESFATWMASKIAQQWRPGFAFDRQLTRRGFATMTQDSYASARQIRQPIESNGDIVNAFDAITYRKGGAVLSMFENFVGEEAFRAGVRLHMERFADDVADIDDFLQSLADGAARPEIAEAFKTFLLQPGVPLLELALECEEGEAELHMSQSRYAALGAGYDVDKTWQVPVCLETDAGTQCHLITEKTQSISLGEQCPAYVMPNAGGRGYYRWTLADDQWDRLMDRFNSLDGQEALALADSLNAGFRAGKLEAATLLAAYRPLAGHGLYDVASAPLDDLKFFARHLVTKDNKAAVERYVADLYGERAERLGLSPDTAMDEEDPSNARLMRDKVIGGMAMLGKDAALRAELAVMADTYLGEAEDGQVHPGEVNMDLIDTALQVAVQDRGAGFADRLMAEMLASNDGQFRMTALRALAHSKDDAVADKVMALALSDKIRANEAEAVGEALAGNPVQYERFWTWFKANFDAFIGRFSQFRAARMIEFAEHACNRKHRDDVAAFFAEHGDAIPGAKRKIELALQSLDQCIALKKEQGAALNKALLAINN